MSATYPSHSLLIRATRAMCALVGIVLLLLQMFSPVLASPGQSMWIEICSEAGAVWVEVDLEDETGDPAAPCPKCADCALCAITSAAPIPTLPLLQAANCIEIADRDHAHLVNPYGMSQLWPETRGPPSVLEINTERALRASMAFTQFTGGAPWS